MRRTIHTAVLAKLSAALLLILSSAAVAQSDANDPRVIVQMFYDFVKKRDCEAAVLLRGGEYTISRCEQVTDVLNVETALAKKTYDMTYLRLAVVTIRNGKEEEFSGFVAFRNIEGRWRWVPKSIKTVAVGAEIENIDDYVAYVRTLLSEPQAEAPPPPPPPAPEALAGAGEGGKTDPQRAVRQPEGRLSPLPDGPTTVAESASSAEGESRMCWPPEALKFREGEQAIRKVKPEPQNKFSPHDVRPPKLKALPEEHRNSVRSVDTGGKKLVALTFDLCEQLDEVTGYDGRIIDYLREERVPATLYVGGKWMLDHPRRAKQLLADPLFEIGNHGWTHGNMRLLTGKEMQDQVLETLKHFYGLKAELLDESKRCTPAERAEIEKKRMRTFRFPYGTCSRESLDYLNARNISAIQWDVVSGDPARGQSAAGIEKAVLSQVKPGSIVVMHANGRGWNTAAALKRIIPELKRKGYRFVTVSDLMAAGTPRTVDECYELRPGDNKDYDRRFGKGTGED
jgi:peptidoglycan/xylan/chitin deacetylase (PgdA/CDA1 family)